MRVRYWAWVLMLGADLLFLLPRVKPKKKLYAKWHSAQPDML
jgi:hypothetical protein